MVFLGPITVSVINGLQANTVRLTLMNVAVATIVMRIIVKVFVVTSMNPAPPVPVAKDLNVSVGMASQVFFLKTCHLQGTLQQFTGNIT